MDEIVLKLPPRTDYAANEAFDALAANIRLSKSVKILVLTSCTDSKNCAATVLEAAKTLAAGRRVLVIDADLRNSPIATEYIAQDKNVGLSNLLLGTAGPIDTICFTDVDGLDLVTAGTPVSNPIALLESTAFDDFLEAVYDEYDHILINTPPILQIADAALVAAAADASALIVNCWSDSHRDLLTAKALLEKSQRPILGTIVTGVSAGKRKRLSRLLSRIPFFSKK